MIVSRIHLVCRIAWLGSVDIKLITDNNLKSPANFLEIGLYNIIGHNKASLSDYIKITKGGSPDKGHILFERGLDD